MSSITYYYQLIDDSYLRISKYERQISGLMEFLKENKKGVEQFSEAIVLRRRNISNSLNGRLLKHLMIKKLNSRLLEAIDTTYENKVLSNFQGVEEDILIAIRKLENQIEDEKCNITSSERLISEIEEERRKEEIIESEESSK